MTCCANPSLGVTESVCPECLATIPAERITEGDTVYLRKTCPEHGKPKTPIWRVLSSYRRFSRPVLAAGFPQINRVALGDSLGRDRREAFRADAFRNAKGGVSAAGHRGVPIRVSRGLSRGVSRRPMRASIASCTALAPRYRRFAAAKAAKSSA